VKWSTTRRVGNIKSDILEIANKTYLAPHFYIINPVLVSVKKLYFQFSTYKQNAITHKQSFKLSNKNSRHEKGRPSYVDADPQDQEERPEAHEQGGHHRHLSDKKYFQR
jgi:hypothetical protein